MDNSLSNHFDNKKEVILVIDKSPTQGIDDTAITTDVEFSINFSRSQRKFCLSLYLMEAKVFLFVNAPEIYKFKVKNSEITIVFKKYFNNI